MKNIDLILANRDWEGLRKLEWGNKKTLRVLMNRIFFKDGITFWHAVEALGEAAAFEEARKQGSSAELVRRYFWSINDESGGNAWNSSEAIGSIMTSNPKECGHFNWMFTNLLEDESLQEGVLWGVLNLAINAPEVVEPLAERVYPFLSAQDANLRGLAVWIFALMNNYPCTEESWEIGEDLYENLLQDQSKAEIYLDGVIYQFPIAELLTKEVLSYCNKVYQQEDFVWNICVASSQKGLCWVGLGTPENEETELKEWAHKQAPNALIIPRCLPNQKALDELEAYFQGKRRSFTVPLDPRGTDFQLMIWEELRRIPYGETRSYGEIAKNVGNPKGSRAVGLANNKNPMAIITPCHRVIGKKGNLVGYASGLEHKERLLCWENAHSINTEEEPE